MTSNADTVFTGGTVFRNALLTPQTGAVAVSDGRIVALDADAHAAIGPDTEIVDLRGGLLLPGFVDAHVHPVEAGLEQLACDLSAERTPEGYLATIAAYAEAHPERPWIVGGGWQQAAFPGGTPLAADLDRVVPDRPVFLQNRDHHGAWVNTEALRLAGIDHTTPDPADGRIERDANGTPNGMLHEGARSLVSRFVPVDTDEDVAAALVAAQQTLHSFGVTGWQDAIVGDYGSHTDTSDAYLQAMADGSLTSDVVGALWWDRDSGLEQIDDLVARRAAIARRAAALGTTTGRFTAGTVKIMQDGIPENRTAAMIDPYLRTCHCGDTAPEHGISFLEPAILIEAVTRLDAAGFQVHFHAIGDRAVRECLDALEAARERNGESDNRHHIAHVQIVHPDDLPRFARLGVTMNMQALWATWEPQMLELNLPLLGDERASWQYPFGDAARLGTLLCAGSDWPVTTPDPWQALHVAVNRTLPADDPDHHPEPLNPGQSLTLGAAIGAYTHGSNRIDHRDDTGVIEVGAVADLVLVDRDPFAGPTTEIAHTRTVGTWIAGRRVFTSTTTSTEQGT
ncbi:amidohydrolase [Plantibacter sp. CFBP 8804]|uniref:amidohydrolase n=1 Tax=Plantibacter sp. CFBP 8804 TaxID=2775270 RepID=UPI001785D721|nr:amidohydrolase [Plantibacter sp. CFBP 8804]MBD8517166.1 amidohydrolase [Plantibacter sp. CFBP 8804]